MKHVKEFESYIYESELNETLNEATTSGRAWSGKIENIDKLLSWMYDKGILNKGEKNEKDVRFRAYYRYYNDGDFPAALKSRGISKWDSKEKIQTALEQYIEEFIKKVLAKYTGKFDRKDFRIDTILADLNTLKSTIDRNDPYSMIYFSDKVKIDDPEFDKLIDQMKKQAEDLQEASDKVVKTSDVYKGKSSYEIPTKNNGITWKKQKMESDKVWTPELEKMYVALTQTISKIGVIIDNVIEATKELKKEIGV